jgi:hypothetical protein
LVEHESGTEFEMSLLGSLDIYLGMIFFNSTLGIFMFHICYIFMLKLWLITYASQKVHLGATMHIFWYLKYIAHLATINRGRNWLCYHLPIVTFKVNSTFKYLFNIEMDLPHGETKYGLRLYNLVWKLSIVHVVKH